MFRIFQSRYVCVSIPRYVLFLSGHCYRQIIYVMQDHLPPPSRTLYQQNTLSQLNSVTIFGDLLDFGQLFKAFGYN